MKIDEITARAVADANIRAPFQIPLAIESSRVEASPHFTWIVLKMRFQPGRSAGLDEKSPDCDSSALQIIW
jgi:hypothetical protein